MSKTSEGDGAARVADCFKNRRLDFVKTVDDLPDRIILGEELRSRSYAGGAGDQNSDEEQQKASHDDLLRRWGERRWMIKKINVE